MKAKSILEALQVVLENYFILMKKIWAAEDFIMLVNFHMVSVMVLAFCTLQMVVWPLKATLKMISPMEYRNLYYSMMSSH